MQDATDFGKILRGLMVRNNLRQVELAKELKVSSSILSNYITGDNITEMDFLAKCVKRFGLEKKELADLFCSAFSSNAISSHHKIVLDTRFIDSDRIDMLSKFLTVSVLCPKMHCKSMFDITPIEELETIINNHYEALDKETDFYPPPTDTKPEVEA